MKETIRQIEQKAILDVEEFRIQKLKDQKQPAEELPDFRPGDKVRVHVRLKEGEKERIQVYEGIVIRRKGGGARETFTVRKISFGVGVERIFPLHSPVIARIEVKTHGRVRRAKLYYLRKRRGKAARVQERKYVASEAKKS